jgi:hypothetical protein
MNDHYVLSRIRLDRFAGCVGQASSLLFLAALILVFLRTLDQTFSCPGLAGIRPILLPHPGGDSSQEPPLQLQR